MDAVDHLIRIGLVNKAKVGIAGGSYGGYASAWGATYYSNRFAAAIPIVGVSNLVSRSVPRTFLRRCIMSITDTGRGINGMKSCSEARVLRQSVSNSYPDPPRKPGPTGRSRTGEGALQPSPVERKSPVRLVMYPGEGHGNAKSASRYDATPRMALVRPRPVQREADSSRDGIDPSGDRSSLSQGFFSLENKNSCHVTAEVHSGLRYPVFCSESLRLSRIGRRGTKPHKPNQSKSLQVQTRNPHPRGGSMATDFPSPKRLQSRRLFFGGRFSRTYIPATAE